MPNPTATTILTSGATSMTFSPDSTRLYIGKADGTVAVVNTATLAIVATWNVGTSLGGITATDDGRYLLTTERTGSQSLLYRIDTTNGSVSSYARAGAAFQDVQVINATTAIVTGGENGGAKTTFDLSTLTFGTISGAVSTVNGGDLSRDGGVTILTERVSSAPLEVYNDATGSFSGFVINNPFLTGVNRGIQTVSERLGSVARVVQEFYSSALVTNFAGTSARGLVFNGIGDTVHTDGLAYNVSGDYLYLHNTDGNIQRYSTETYTLVDTIANIGATTRTTGQTYGDQLIVDRTDSVIAIRDTGTGRVTLLGSTASNQTFTGSTGADAFAGGAGADRYTIDNPGDTITEFDDLGFDTAVASVNFVLPNFVERLELVGTATDGTGNSRNNDIVGNALDNVLRGMGGADILYGNDGNDLLDGGPGADRLFGGAGDDILIGDAFDYFDGGPGIDTVDYSGAPSAVNTAAVAGPPFVNVEIVIGSRFDDTLRWATPGDHVLSGGAGNDSIFGGPGNDILRGDQGDDTISGALGNDIIYGGDGDDTLNGNDGDDIIDGGAGFNTIDGGNGIDTIDYRSRTTSAIGVRLDLGQGPNRNSLGQYERIFGIENVEGSAYDDSIYGDGGANRLAGNNGDDFLIGNGGNDWLLGGLGNDLLAGGDGNDIVDGGAGDDGIDGGTGADTLIGGDGNDVISVDNLGDVVVEAVGGGNDRVIAYANYRLTAGAEIELLGIGVTTALNMAGNEFSQTVIGNDAVNVLEGLGGNDTLFGYGGNDVLAGGDGNDTVDGGAGDDGIDGGTGIDTLIGGDGNDVISVDDLGDVVVEAVGGGNDRVIAYATYRLTAGVEVELLAAGALTAINLAGNEFAQTVIGNDAANVLEGLGGNDALFGYGGNDMLDGGTGVDALFGGTGDDTYLVDDFSDYAFEYAREGTDTVIASNSVRLNLASEIEVIRTSDANGTGNFLLLGSDTAQSITGNAGNNIILGYGGNDQIFGGAGDDSINGGTGADLMDGGTGNDNFTVDNVGDTIVEAAGGGYDRVFAMIDYTLAEGVEIELFAALDQTGSVGLKLTGNSFGQSIFGTNGADVLNGGGGDDALYGLGGADTLIGGQGNDQFIFSTTLGAVDTIGDFTSGQDRILLDRTIFAALPVGSLAASSFVVGTAALDADDRIIFDTTLNGGTLLYDADGNGAGVAVAFAQIGNVPILPADFYAF